MQRVHIEGLTRQGWSEAPTSPSNSQQPCQIMRAGSFCRLSKAPVGAGRSARLLRSQTGADTVRPGSSRQPPQIRTSERFFFSVFFTFDVQSWALLDINSAKVGASSSPPVLGTTSCLRERRVLSLLHGLFPNNRPGCLPAHIFA